MDNINYDNLLNEFLKMIRNSWTYDKMTPEEKQRCIDALAEVYQMGFVKGAVKARWEQMNAHYRVFLKAIGYNGCTWRETEKASF